MTSRRTILLAGAGITSGIGVAMAAAAAAERAVTITDRALVIAVACVIVLGAHLLPSITRTRLGRALWVCCLLLTAWGHSAFFIASAGRAGESRADHVQASTQTQALRDELQATQARPLAAVSADLAISQTREIAARTAAARCIAEQQPCSRLQSALAITQARTLALADELAQARRAAQLRQQLTATAGAHDTQRAAAAVDPVAAALAGTTGISPGALSTGASVLSAVVMEMLAALLWSAGLQTSPAAHTPASDQTDAPAPAATEPTPSAQLLDSTETTVARASRRHPIRPVIHGRRPARDSPS
jgi:hypothetical protein